MRFSTEYPGMSYLGFNQLCHEELQHKGFDPYEFEIRSIEICGSTNDYAKLLLNRYSKSIVLSITQENGRGRGEKSWMSPIGGVWLSLGFNLERPVQELSTPIVEAIQKYLSQSVICEIKPPNDILINDKKVCGVLIESIIEGDRFIQVIIGIGINVFNEIPESIKNIATRLSDYAQPPNIPQLASEVVTVVINIIKKLGMI